MVDERGSTPKKMDVHQYENVALRRPLERSEKVVITFQIFGPLEAGQYKDFNQKFDALLNGGMGGVPGVRGERLGSTIRAKMSGDPK
jgi:hypothetical protein